jgi:hypothetical protein
MLDFIAFKNTLICSSFCGEEYMAIDSGTYKSARPDNFIFGGFKYEMQKRPTGLRA